MERTMYDVFDFILDDPDQPLIVTLAKEIVDMYSELKSLRVENRAMKEDLAKRNKQLWETISNNERNMERMIFALITPGDVTDKAEAMKG